MISLNISAIFNYEETMNKTAYGYYNSKILIDKANNPVLSLKSSPPRLFYNSEFIPSHNFWKCFKYTDYPNILDKKSFCIEKLKAKTIIVEENYLEGNDNFDCDLLEFKETPRNIFKSSNFKVDFCRKR